MTKIATILLALALTGCVSGPPARFDHPFSGTLHLGYADTETIHKVCRNSWAAGCMFKLTKTDCWVLINQRYRNNASMVTHERGHCNGWTGRHEQ